MNRTGYYYSGDSEGLCDVVRAKAAIWTRPRGLKGPRGYGNRKSAQGMARC